MLQKSTNDSTIELIHEIRRQISKKFNGNLNAIAKDAEQRARESGRLIWNPKPNSQKNTAD